MSVLIYPGTLLCVMCAHRREKREKKLHIGASRQDNSLKCFHFLSSYIGKPAAPQETNNGLVITPRQHSKELLTRSSSDFITEKHAHPLIQFMSNCTKGLPEEWRWVKLACTSSLHPLRSQWRWTCGLLWWSAAPACGNMISVAALHNLYLHLPALLRWASTKKPPYCCQTITQVCCSFECYCELLTNQREVKILPH